MYISVIEKYNNLKVIGDITCDVNGSIPTTSRPSTIIDPYYYIDRTTLQEINQHNQALAIMAVDNLPSELPKDSSKEFGDGIVKEVLPYILEKDDGIEPFTSQVISPMTFRLLYFSISFFSNNRGDLGSQ